MVAATVISNPAEVRRSGAHTDEKELGNLLAVTAGGNMLKKGLYKATVDPANAADGVGETIQLTGCVGVVLGRTAVVGIIPGVDLQDFLVTGYVQADGVIELRLQNESVATTNLASSTWYVITETVAANL